MGYQLLSILHVDKISHVHSSKRRLDYEQNFPFHIVHMPRGFFILCAYSKSLNALTNKFVLHNGVLFLQMANSFCWPTIPNVRHCWHVLENFRPQNVEIGKLPMFRQCLLQLSNLM